MLADDMKSDNLQYNMLGRWEKRLIDQASDVLSIFLFIISYRLRTLKTFYFCKIINWNNFCKWWKKIILGTSEWDDRPIDPAYYIEGCRIWWAQIKNLIWKNRNTYMKFNFQTFLIKWHFSSCSLWLRNCNIWLLNKEILFLTKIQNHINSEKPKIKLYWFMAKKLSEYNFRE